jgi:hypothetical protein
MTNARPLGDIAIELKTLHRNNVIRSGELLLEAQAQQGYGDFRQWVEDYFDGNFSTAYNHMAAAKLAARFPTVGNLRLRASALHTLGLGIEGGRWDQAVIDALFAEAEVTWVNADRAQETWDLHNKTEETRPRRKDEEDGADASGDDDIDDDDDTEKEKTAKAEAGARDRVIAEIQRAKEAIATKARTAQKEAEAILEDPQPVLPPAQPVQDEDVAAFEQFIDMGMMNWATSLTTAPRASRRTSSRSASFCDDVSRKPCISNPSRIPRSCGLGKKENC